MHPAIRVEGLAKRYQLGAHQGSPYRTLRESLTEAIARPWGRLAGAIRPRSPASASAEAPDVLWALKDVSFEVPSGEVIGIIGGNGAGKSTLLKILSRITEPTAGRVEIRGRVGSLLEVGTGFHSELTGRENIFLSGAILGMSRREIQRKFEQIVEFAGVERFLDTPAKRYSSGMYVRLAFAVAAHLNPEVLIVDEVLAVGDAEFQKKCLGKMQDISRGGRTVFFVSHNMDAVQRLCTHVLRMQHGRLVGRGSPSEMIAQHLASSTGSLLPDHKLDLTTARRKGTQEARFLAVAYTSATPAAANRMYPDGPVHVSLQIESDRPRRVANLAVSIWSQHGSLLVNTDTVLLGQNLQLQEGRNEVMVRIDQLHLKPGSYLLGLFLGNPGQTFDQIEPAAEIEVVDVATSDAGMRPGVDGCVTCRFAVTWEKDLAPAAPNLRPVA